MISDLKEFSGKIVEKFLVINATKGVTNVGAPYFNMTLQDASGQIEGRKWEVKDNDVEIFSPGNIVEITAEVVKYRTSLQLKVLTGRVLDQDEYNVIDFVSSAPVAKERLQKQLIHFIQEIGDIEIRNVVEDLIGGTRMTSFMIYPAASKNHHEYLSGLLHHTVGMLNAAEALLNVYPSLNKDYLYAGVILHDVGKLIELSSPIMPKYTVAGKLIGHISIVQAQIMEACQRLNISDETSIILQHLVLSHHGKKEFGSPVEPMIKEAEVLSMIDNLDARINMIDKALKDVEEGEFSQRIMSLDGRSFYKPKTKK